MSEAQLPPQTNHHSPEMTAGQFELLSEFNNRNLQMSRNVPTNRADGIVMDLLSGAMNRAAQFEKEGEDIAAINLALAGSAFGAVNSLDARTRAFEYTRNNPILDEVNGGEVHRFAGSIAELKDTYGKTSRDTTSVLAGTLASFLSHIEKLSADEPNKYKAARLFAKACTAGATSDGSLQHALLKDISTV